MSMLRFLLHVTAINRHTVTQQKLS